MVADKLGVAQQTLAHYEVGRLRMPTSLLPKLAQLFGVGVDDLAGLWTAPVSAVEAADGDADAGRVLSQASR